MFSLRSSVCTVTACVLALLLASTAAAAPLGDLDFADSGTLVLPATSVGHSNTAKVTFKNSGSDSVDFLGLSITGPDADQFSIDQTCMPTLGSGSSCDIDVGFTPDHAGAMQAELVVDNDGLTPQITRALSGDASAADLSLSSTSIDFGIVDVHDGGQSFWVSAQNNGLASVHVDQVDIDGPDSSAFWIDGSNCPGQTLTPFSNCSFYVRFQPQEGRTYDATLHVRAPGADFTASLTGVGGVSNATLAPTTVEFESVEVGRTSTATVTMTSSGNLPYIPFVTIFNGGDVGAFRIVKDGCSLQLLSPGDSCMLTLRFAPTDVGPAAATLAVLGDGDPKVVTARGVGLEPGTPSSRPGTVGDGPPVGQATAATDGPRTARVAFVGARRHMARYSSGWAYLGRARCDGAPRCRVTVRTQFVVTFGDTERPYVVRGRGRTWTVGAGRRLWAPLPRNLQGTPARVLVTIETRAEGQTPGMQYRNLRLVPARR